MSESVDTLENAMKTVSVLSRYVSSYRAFRALKEITLYHRIQGSPGLLDAAERMEEIILETGPENIETELIVYSGKTGPSWLPLPTSWSVVNAELSIEGRTYRLQAHPTMVAAHSPPTEGRVEGEVVRPADPLDRESYRDKEKIYLITDHYQLAYRIAAEEGVAGVILAKKSARPDAFPYIGLFLSVEEAGKYTTPAVTVPWREAEHLEGKKVSIRIDADIGGPGQLPVLAAWVGDRSGPGPVIIGHLCHPSPGANDNASGVSSSIEAFIALAEAYDEGALPQPSVTVRLLLVPEYTGTILSMEGWLGDKAGPAVNLDMVGASQAAGVSPARIYYPPLSAPEHALADRLYWASRLGGTSIGLTYYMYGSDHDVFLSYGFESEIVNQWPDPQYHSDKDDADKIDPERLREAALTAAVATHLTATGVTLPTVADRIVDLLVERRVREGDMLGARLAAYYAPLRYGLPPRAKPPVDWRPEGGDKVLGLAGGRRLLFTLALPGQIGLEDAVMIARAIREVEPRDVVYGELMFSAARETPLGAFYTLARAAYGARTTEKLSGVLETLESLGLIAVR